ncbi:Gp37-like protein [Anaerosacchariphilus polymeriproducens]|uniref:Uncharacterized protein n=1 Tax=Anaerosacchariphilus polymeriproducens TaxID=1812858 RepID=A0A371AT61_9FIRM|nr:hypothetical protein [Anaerosacchariphilus polymeriproducens]RDU22755.1 hypothetical protein DWV06_13380 [Anaerosacchariphilus polymeriproducens]
MEFILTDNNRKELNYMRHNSDIDLDIGDTNDFKISMSFEDYLHFGYDFGYMFFAESTEYGGIFGQRHTNTETNIVELSGYTYRGLLSKKIIEPPSGVAYKTVTGECNSIISSIIGSNFDSLFQVGYYDYNTQTVITDSGFSVSNYSFDRYTDVLSGLTKMLKSVGAKLQIQCVSGNTNEPFTVYLSATPINDFSEEIEYSQDNKINFITSKKTNGINHLICLGQGELTARTVVHLYADADGNISQTKTFSGINERAAVYDYPSAEDENTLITEGKENFKELMNMQSIEISVDDLSVELGDIIGGRDRLTGFYIKEQITNKIVKIDNGKLSIDYKVGES